MLQKRLEQCTYTDLSPETFHNRNKLLKEYAKPLLDEGNRKELERILKTFSHENNDIFYLSVSKGYELAALLLLLESRQFDECYHLSISYFEEQQSLHQCNSNLDLCRILAYATLEHARELKANRYYECAANIMEQGLRLLDNASIENLVVKSIRTELNDITPYRILDLLSRNTDELSRDLGLSMLDGFVTHRGGLDGESHLYMTHNEFKAFFRQIRYFLTLQEQIDLYKHWSALGDNSARFLLGISMTACGFSRRKPERLVQALEVMKNLDCDDLKNVITYISLLLGNIDNLEDYVVGSNKTDSKTHVSSSSYTLASVCSDCRDWLENDVLDGYRDVEIDSDLEAYFGDSDVTSFIERNDVGMQSEKSNKPALNPFANFKLNTAHDSVNLQSSDRSHKDKSKSQNPMVYTSASIPQLFTKNNINKPKQIAVLSAAVLLIAMAIYYIIAKRAFMGPKYLKTPSSSSYYPQQQQPTSTNSLHDINSKLVTSSQSRVVSFERELSTIISKWLAVKTMVLSGGRIPLDIDLIATIDAINRLQIERQEDQSSGQIQKISAKLINLSIRSREANSVLVDTRILYSDYRLDNKNQVIEKTSQRILSKQYTLVNENSMWKLQ
jgi:ARC6-like, IMS domain